MQDYKLFPLIGVDFFSLCLFLVEQNCTQENTRKTKFTHLEDFLAQMENFSRKLAIITKQILIYL